jgi:hypothetical protein
MRQTTKLVVIPAVVVGVILYALYLLFKFGQPQSLLDMLTHKDITPDYGVFDDPIPPDDISVVLGGAIDLTVLFVLTFIWQCVVVLPSLFLARRVVRNLRVATGLSITVVATITGGTFYLLSTWPIYGPYAFSMGALVGVVGVVASLRLLQPNLRWSGP